uniref:Uncharacterized protein n=1 Tax=Rhizophora mucronata TaxID=61149 RepID=A0A2P2QK70_RHIMU
MTLTVRSTSEGCNPRRDFEFCHAIGLEKKRCRSGRGKNQEVSFRQSDKNRKRTDRH